MSRNFLKKDFRRNHKLSHNHNKQSGSSNIYYINRMKVNECSDMLNLHFQRRQNWKKYGINKLW